MMRRTVISMATAFACMAGTVVAAYQISSQLEQFSQWLLSRIKPELEVMIGSIDMRSINQFVVSDLYMRPKAGDGSESIWVERLTLEVEWAPPVSIRLKSIKADQPVLRVGDRLLDILMGARSGEASAGGHSAPPLPALQIRDGDARLRIADLPPTSFRFSADTDRSGSVRVTLDDIRAGQLAALPADAGSPARDGVSVESLIAELPRDILATRKLSKIELVKPAIRFTPGAVTPWRIVRAKDEGGGPTPEAQSAASSATTVRAGPITVPEALKGWEADMLTVTGGSISLTGYPPEMPVVDMEFSGSLTGLALGGKNIRNNHSLTATNLRVATSFAPSQPFLVVPEATVGFSVADLLDRRIASLDVSNASLTLDRAFRSMAALREHRSEGAAQPANDPVAAPARPFWLVERIRFRNARITLADLGAGVPDIAFRLPSPTLSNVALTGDTRSASESVERIEVADIVLHSPLDPFTPVVTLPSVFVEFSLAGLLRREIDVLRVLHPTIYVGKDLFWFIDNSRKAAEASQGGHQAADKARENKAEKPVGWKLGTFQISHGRLAIASEGANRLALPIPFETRATDISFANISDLRLDLDIEVPTEDYRFPSYQLELLKLAGTLRFGLPPGSNTNNLVNTLTSKSVVWRQFQSGDAWVSVTYDVEGIYGKFGAAAYGGYLDGGFTFFLNPEASWTGWANGTGIDLGDFTAVVSPGNLSLDSSADFSVQVNAEGPSIQRVVGSFATTSPGQLAIPRLDALLERLPPEWSQLKRDIARIGIDALRRFRYESGEAKFWFIDKHGRLNMALTGPEGSRTFDIVIHDTPFSAPMLWEQSYDFSTSIQLGQTP